MKKTSLILGAALVSLPLTGGCEQDKHSLNTTDQEKNSLTDTTEDTRKKYLEFIISSPEINSDFQEYSKECDQKPVVKFNSSSPEGVSALDIRCSGMENLYYILDYAKPLKKDGGIDIIGKDAHTPDTKGWETLDLNALKSKK